MDVPVWQQLWNKGVDIAASVIASTISAAIIAFIATATWRWKRSRDLKFEEDKQRQQNRVVRDLAEETRRVEAAALHEKLKADTAEFIASMARAHTSQEIASEWERYVSRLQSNDLMKYAGNRKIVNEVIPYNLRGLSDANVAVFANNLRDLMTKTELMSPERSLSA